MRIRDWSSDVCSSDLLADEILAEPMGEGAKDDIDACEIDLIDFRQRRYIEMPQMREDIAQLLTGLAIGGQRGDLDMAMRGEQADQFRAGVAGCAQDSGLECHEFSLGSDRKSTRLNSSH